MDKDLLDIYVFATLTKATQNCYDFSESEYKTFFDAYQDNKQFHTAVTGIMKDMRNQGFVELHEDVVNQKLKELSVHWFKLDDDVDELEKLGCKKIKEFAII